MSMIRLPLIGPAYTPQSRTADYEALINLMIEQNQSPNAGDNPYILLPIPGLTAWTTLPTTPLRGMFTQNERLFLVAGNTLYEVLEDKTQNVLNPALPLNIDANPCTFACSGDISNQLLVSSGNHAYVFNLTTNAFTDVLTGAAFVGFVTNFFLALDVATSTLHVSNFNDATVFPAGQDQQRSISGDKWKSMLVDSQYVWLFGGQKTDVYNLAASGNTIFVPVQGVTINEGISAPFSACMVDNAPQWLNQTERGRGMILRAENFAAVKRSTFAVDFAIQGYDMPQDAVAWSYQDEGHNDYILNFPTDKATWCDDAAMPPDMSWHQRGYWNPATMAYDAYRPQFHAFCFGKHLVGDRASGTVYELTNDSALDVDGQGIRRLRRTSPMRSNMNRVFYGQMILNMDVGLGLGAGQGVNPQVMARWSNDGGRTWGNEHWRSAGAMGKWGTRVNWSNGGAGYQRVYEFVMTDPVPWRLIGGYVEAEASAA